jgi:hypothetical protein
MGAHLERERVLLELTRLNEIEQLKNSTESMIPNGEPADLVVSGFDPETGTFDFVGVFSPGTPTLGSDDRNSLQRSQTIPLSGKANSLNPSSGSSPAGVTTSRGVKFVARKRDDNERGGLRVENSRRVDSIRNDRERNNYEHPDRRLA